ncbi:hypothetical protein POM88_001483 [Heracleum sosnowskyi]|uniref:Uncharacterized protein n=1 Tax=Heracleum sosnowskyi TaxID=360622 RepID=A0AAD8JEZ0_9APIA|nr:hypothetical protein POM88_001483 [Heracleum sosnowskyi]
MNYDNSILSRTLQIFAFMDKGKEKKKRKVENVEEETEEEIMEKFFALIKSTRRVGGVDRWKESEDQVKDNEEKPKINMSAAAAAGWCPMFQPEDFLINKISSVPGPATEIAASSTTADDDQNKQEIAEEGNDILNLKLSL